MTERLRSMKRLVDLQKKIAQLRIVQQAQSQTVLNKLTRESASMAEILESGVLAWSVFPDLSNRFYARLEHAKQKAADAARMASGAAGREGRMLESLLKQHAGLRREEFERHENDARLESMRFGPAASVSRKVD
jgi:hypothetical protein